MSMESEDNTAQLIGVLFGPEYPLQKIQLQFHDNPDFDEHTLFLFCCDILIGGVRRLYGKEPQELNRDQLGDVAHRLLSAGIQLNISEAPVPPDFLESEDIEVFAAPDVDTVIDYMQTRNEDRSKTLEEYSINLCVNQTLVRIGFSIVAV